MVSTFKHARLNTCTKPVVKIRKIMSNIIYLDSGYRIIIFFFQQIMEEKNIPTILDGKQHKHADSFEE